MGIIRIISALRHNTQLKARDLFSLFSIPKKQILTFHHLHILQRKFPQEFVFTGCVDDAGSRVSEEEK